jgi:hypothetical protein
VSNLEILKNLDRCMRGLNDIIVKGYNDKWDDDTLDHMECIIDSLDYNFKEMEKNNERMDI